MKAASVQEIKAELQASNLVKLRELCLQLAKFKKAKVAYEKYGIYGMAILDPILIGSPFSAAVSVAAGVKPLKVTLILSVAVILWAAVIAWVAVTLGVST
jgi:hypothetical protein